ncbi:hypothetical protein CEY12_19515 [Chryseobacterium sp. T16E-39]|uniref:hypothetical protein n=1 Tax=Chryseobacterium sp. T16E-39 TaxID=2015076 RepID=UPI000B5B3055|nr:hypothetical protein [Chryseobacterium sp. T16E-39]ASK32152.1 hypothetical protein CEY12_19515 [Chryseobacterium sp. T16E-39]
MEKTFKLTGGARIGLANATYPFADLYVDENTLKINASLVGNLIFQPQDIISIQPYTSLPLIGQGIKINHNVENYNSNVIFWTLKNPDTVINEIKNTGFLDNKNAIPIPRDSKIIERQTQGGFPLKPIASIFFIVAWNALFIFDFFPVFKDEDSPPTFPGPGVCSALGLIFISTLLTLISSGFRRFILKDGRTLEDIRKLAIFILVLTGFILTVFLVISLVN